jgi:hypothetical protein
VWRGKIRLECFTGEFLVDLGDLQWEAVIRTCVAIADKARDLRLDFSVARIASILAFAWSRGMLVITVPTCSRKA